MKEYTRRPIFFEENRVWRVYQGGHLLGRFLGGDETDGNFPEEWISSTVLAANHVETKPNEGLSVIKGSDVTMRELGDTYPELMYGHQKDLGVLVKYLDSAIRLPLQAHPDKAYSRQYFDSDYGKTEMWLILATRENASICFGFKEQLTKEEFSAIVERSRDEHDIMDGYLNRVPVKPGEVYLIPAKAVHAIGAGCLILEVQEPTDFTISPEYWCGDHLLNAHEMYMGLSKDIALDCFDYSLYGPECISVSRKTPRLLSENDAFTWESLISKEDTPCFSVNRYQVKTQMQLKRGPAIYVIANGAGLIKGEQYEITVKQGDYFFLPYAAKELFSVVSESGSPIEIVECLPAGG